LDKVIKRSFRFIFSGENDGKTNMAMDEAVMLGLAEGISSPVLRIYKWTPPTISIGYFQKASDIDFDRCQKNGIGVVRRITGGRAVLHFQELTYSILFTHKDFSPFNKKSIFLFVAKCLLDSLAFLGIKSRIAEKTRGDLRSADCFASPAQFEIESYEHGKLIGSAQVIKNGVVLQHGAIPLTGAYADISLYLKGGGKGFKQVSSLNQAAQSIIGEETLLKSLKEGFGKHIPLVNAELNDYEIDKTIRLANEKYGADWWTFLK